MSKNSHAEESLPYSNTCTCLIKMTDSASQISNYIIDW